VCTEAWFRFSREKPVRSSEVVEEGIRADPVLAGARGAQKKAT
jgi:hypothetical protein